jgi:hypothetical protein
MSLSQCGREDRRSRSHARAMEHAAGLSPGVEYETYSGQKEMIANAKKLETIFLLIVRTMSSSQ